MWCYRFPVCNVCKIPVIRTATTLSTHSLHEANSFFLRVALNNCSQIHVPHISCFYTHIRALIQSHRLSLSLSLTLTHTHTHTRAAQSITLDVSEETTAATMAGTTLGSQLPAQTVMESKDSSHTPMVNNPMVGSFLKEYAIKEEKNDRRPPQTTDSSKAKLEEAAACLNRKAVLMAKAAAASGVPAAEVNLEAWIEV